MSDPNNQNPDDQNDANSEPEVHEAVPIVDGEDQDQSVHQTQSEKPAAPAKRSRRSRFIRFSRNFIIASAAMIAFNFASGVKKQADVVNDMTDVTTEAIARARALEQDGKTVNYEDVMYRTPEKLRQIEESGSEKDMVSFKGLIEQVEAERAAAGNASESNKMTPEQLERSIWTDVGMTVGGGIAGALLLSAAQAGIAGVRQRNRDAKEQSQGHEVARSSPPPRNRGVTPGGMG